MSNLKSQAVALRDLLSDPTRWTRGTMARDDYRIAVNPCSQGAICFCLGGAVAHVERLACDAEDIDDVYRAVNASDLAKRLAQVVNRRMSESDFYRTASEQLYRFNDGIGMHTTHEDIVSVLNELVEEVSA
jgi:hypothetical protein